MQDRRVYGVALVFTLLPFPLDCIAWELGIATRCNRAAVWVTVK